MKPFQPMAWRFKSNTKPRPYRGFEKDSDMMEVVKVEDGDLQTIDFIGSGVLMFPVDDLMMIDKPWFGEVFHRESMKRRASMDTRFVWELKQKAGATVWCDTTIEVGHINPFVIDRTYQDRFMDWQEVGYGECKANLESLETEKSFLSESAVR